MKKILIVVSFAIVMLTACKTTEANYRAAYEKAVEARDADDREEKIYGGESRRLDQKLVVSGGDSVAVSVKMVSPVAEKGAEPPKVKKYMVIAGQFKQNFNAQSLCRRLADAGYDAAVVQTAEPYYYVVASSFDKATEADAAMEQLKKHAPVSMKDPLPFILMDPRK